MLIAFSLHVQKTVESSFHSDHCLDFRKVLFPFPASCHSWTRALDSVKLLCLWSVGKDFCILQLCRDAEKLPSYAFHLPATNPTATARMGFALLGPLVWNLCATNLEFNSFTGPGDISLYTYLHTKLPRCSGGTTASSQQKYLNGSKGSFAFEGLGQNFFLQLEC